VDSTYIWNILTSWIL